MLKQKSINNLNQEKIIEIIKKYDVISFDIFDTLIKRDCAEGKTVFEMMELNLSQTYSWIGDFSERRRMAESHARAKCLREEVTFKEIYVELEAYYSKEEIEFLCREEIEYELALCHVSHHIKKVYDYCISNNKTVIITSDMYLPYDVIISILLKAGLIGYKKLYLSSQLHLTKQTGHLFDYIIKDLNISPKDMIHLGDNKNSDVLMPMKKGIRALYIPNMVYNNLAYNSKFFITNSEISEYRAICSFIDNRISNSIISDDKYFESAGYEMEGPLLVGFAKWLKQEFDKTNVEKIFFLSRDGQIMEKAYKRIYGEDRRIEYMYASRRAFIVPILWMFNNLSEMITVMFFPRVGTIEAFIKKMGLETQKYINTIEKYGYDYKKVYSYDKLFKEDSFNKFYNEIKEDIYINSKTEYEILLKYLKQIEFNGKIALVDIGWHGNMQKALIKICKMSGIEADITGFYLGLNPNVDCKKQGIKANGYLFHRGYNEEYFELQRTFTSILEMMFTADHGSVRKFVVSQRGVKPIFEPFEYDSEQSKAEFEVILNIQNGALRFIDDIVEQSKFTVMWSAKAVFQNLILLGNAPDYRASCMFGNIKCLEDKITYIANPSKSILFYALHPLRLKQDLAVNPWKIGFFKRACIVDFPYFEIYTILRKVFLLWRK